MTDEPANNRDDLNPTTDQDSTNNQPEPGTIGVDMTVPQDLVNTGQPTNEPRDDSPESLDDEIAQGLNREDIDPDHSYDRPAVNNIDEEENGVN